MPRIILSASIALAALMMPAFGGEPAPAGTQAQAVSNAFDITVGGSLMSDYVSRGISQSARRPAVATSIDIQYGWFYVSGELRSVKLPTNPAAELTLTGGVRRSYADIDFDVSAAYFYYPGETPSETQTTTDYWQGGISASRRFMEAFTLAGLATYSPYVSHTGAWGSYAAGTITFDLPKLVLAQGRTLDWTLAAELGHARFGNTTLGDYALPAYTHWRLGLAFRHAPLRFDLSYHDTNLTKEDCYVQTGDLAATPGGSVNPSSNPAGLRSGLCGRALVGTLSFEFEASKSD